MTDALRSSTRRVGALLLRLRWLVRTPVWLYRAKLGAVFGNRLLMLEHVGRTSGRLRYVVLEIVDHPTAYRYVVVSGFGDRAQWYRNVKTNPQVRISLGSHAPASAVAVRLEADAAAASLRRYASNHPRSWAKLRPVLEETLGTRIDERGSSLPVIAIDLTGHPNSLQRSVTHLVSTSVMSAAPVGSHRPTASCLIHLIDELQSWVDTLSRTSNEKS